MSQRLTNSLNLAFEKDSAELKEKVIGSRRAELQSQQELYNLKTRLDVDGPP